MGLLRHLRWVTDPNYRGFCIRKNSTAIMKSGGLFQEAVKLYSQYDPKLKVKLKDQKVVFSSGAEVSFSHYENSNAAQLYQGLQLSSVFYDEATHANEEDIWWLVSRLRTDANMTPSIWLSCNPDPDSFLFDWVKYWLYPEGHESYGLPDPEKNGKTRWIVRRNGVINWGDSREEMIERYGEKCMPLAFQVLLGTIYDNPVLMENQPEYLSNLEALPDVERRRLLLGDWTAREAGSSYFDRKNCPELAESPPAKEFEKIVRAYDFAGTLPHDSNRSPDYFASVKMGKMKNGQYVVLDVVRTRITFGDWLEHILENARRDGPGVDIVLAEDPNPASKASTKLLAQSLIEQGFITKTRRASAGKLDAFRPFAASAELGVVSVVKGCATDLWNKIDNNNEFFYKELEAFDGKRRSGESGHDDMVDCCSLAYLFLAQRIKIPSFSTGLLSSNLTYQNPFSNVKGG